MHGITGDKRDGLHEFAMLSDDIRCVLDSHSVANI